MASSGSSGDPGAGKRAAPCIPFGSGLEKDCGTCSDKDNSRQAAYLVKLLCSPRIVVFWLVVRVLVAISRSFNLEMIPKLDLVSNVGFFEPAHTLPERTLEPPERTLRDLQEHPSSLNSHAALPSWKQSLKRATRQLVRPMERL
jgi:hypothetical protein